MEMYLAGKWTTAKKSQPVTNPYDGQTIDETPLATPADIDRALGGLVEGAKVMRQMPAWKRAEILDRASALLNGRTEEFAKTITREEGKPIRESRVEARRAVDVLKLSAEEARRLSGETLPMDGYEASAGRMGFTLRVPCGVVAAITPFNFPLNLAAHKVGPAIAGGNAVLLKPPSNTPLSGLNLTRLLLEAGLPDSAIACVTGPGGELGKAICEDSRVRKISFTGSYEVGEMICKTAGVKRVTMELGGNSPVVVMDDADLSKAAKAIASAGYANAGQVCISAQRIVVQKKIRSELVEALEAQAAEQRLGDPSAEETTIGPLVREADAKRVEEWLQEARKQGARIVTGGSRDGAFVSPAVVDDVTPQMRIGRDELFGPAVGIMPVSDVREAIEIANSTPYGLSAGVFTQDIDRAMAFAREVDSGSVHINWSSQWRADFMPYGGLKNSGFGKEGPRYAIREMTEEKTVILHLNERQ